MAARRLPDPRGGDRPARTVIRSHADEELGLGANPLDDLDADDPVAVDFYAPTLPPAPAPPPARQAPPPAPPPPPAPQPASSARASRGRGRQPLKEGKTFRLVTFSFYEDDVGRLDALLKAARQKGHRRASRSQIVRLALRQVDLDTLPDDG